MSNFTETNIPEILAPGGSAQGIIAALNSGADAVYAGGQLFGARAYADNPDSKAMVEIIEEVHRRNKKLYLTVNTLLKDQELEGQLVDYLVPFYEAGLDAVIVQDLGVMSVIKHHFPQMHIHASTQMTVTSSMYAQFLKEQGVTRVVPARELSLTELKAMKAATGMEIETFVHGALCYCYSGKCLMSSIIGGRSGNRGRCAQPCRLPYTFSGEKSSGKGFLLSPKDTCTLELIPDMIEAGIDSFKIEGRMKKPEYAALVTSLYRKYRDLYIEKGRQGFRVEKEDINDLMDLYNRGGFTTGYYKQHNGKDMMSIEKPNHMGTKGAKVVSVNKSQITLEALEDLYIKDVLVKQDKSDQRPVEITLKEDVLKGQKSVVQCGVKGVQLGNVFYRTRNNKLIDNLKHGLEKNKYKEKLNGDFTISKGIPAKLTVQYKNYKIEVTGPVIEEAKSNPAVAENVIARLEKTGDTDFSFGHIDLHMDGDVFVPVSVINNMRREAIDLLIKKLEESKHRIYNAPENFLPYSLEEKTITSEPKELRASFETIEQYNGLMDVDVIKVFYADYFLLDALNPKVLEDMVKMTFDHNKKIYVALPYICREDFFVSQGTRLLTILKNVQGVLVRNVESFLWLKQQELDLDIVLDRGVYTWNQAAKGFWYNQGAKCLSVPEELNYKELKHRACQGEEMVVYGYTPLMVSAQCLFKTTTGCKKSEKNLTGIHHGVLTDRTGRNMQVATACKNCYNVIYNSQCLSLEKDFSQLDTLGLGSMRLEFTIESKDQVIQVAKRFADLCQGKQVGECDSSSYTRGHFKRGVE